MTDFVDVPKIPRCSEQVAKQRKVSIRPTVLAVIGEFRDGRVSMRDPIGFWKFSKVARLKVLRKVISAIVYLLLIDFVIQRQLPSLPNC